MSTSTHERIQRMCIVVSVSQLTKLNEIKPNQFVYGYIGFCGISHFIHSTDAPINCAICVLVFFLIAANRFRVELVFIYIYFGKVITIVEVWRNIERSVKESKMKIEFSSKEINRFISYEHRRRYLWQINLICTPKI